MFLIAVSLFMVGTAYSQISIGPKAGVNFSTITGKNNSLDKKSLVGFNVGVVTNIGISEMFSIQPELFFSQQGYRFGGTVLDSPATVTQTFNYVNLPILAKATFGEGNVRGYVNLGPYVGYMVGGKNTVDLQGNKSTSKTDFALEKQLNRFDFGIAAGGGALFKLGQGDLMLDLRYSLGLTTVSDKVIFETGRDTNSVPSISVGYLFPLGGQ